MTDYSFNWINFGGSFTAPIIWTTTDSQTGFTGWSVRGETGLGAGGLCTEKLLFQTILFLRSISGWCVWTYLETAFLAAVTQHVGRGPEDCGSGICQVLLQRFSHTWFWSFSPRLVGELVAFQRKTGWGETVCLHVSDRGRRCLLLRLFFFWKIIHVWTFYHFTHLFSLNQNQVPHMELLLHLSWSSADRVEFPPLLRRSHGCHFSCWFITWCWVVSFKNQSEDEGQRAGAGCGKKEGRKECPL